MTLRISTPTRPTLIRFIYAFVGFCFCISTAIADTSLSGATIERWIASQDALEKWGDEHQETISKYEDQLPAMENPMDISARDMLKPLKAAGLYDEAQDLVKKYDFPSLENWAETTLKITRTAAAIELEKHPDAFDTSQLETLAQSPQITEEQKAMIQQTIKQSQSIMMQLKDGSSDADKAAVRPYLKQISGLMEN